MEGIPALSLWETVMTVFYPEKAKRCGKPQAMPKRDPIIEILLGVDYVPPSVPPSLGLAHLYVMEDSEAVIKMTIKGRSPNMRHVIRTQRVDLDWLFERVRVDPGVHMRYIGTKQQMPDIMTKGSFTSTQWRELCKLSNMGPKYPNKSPTQSPAPSSGPQAKGKAKGKAAKGKAKGGKYGGKKNNA